ncbi:MAG: hypothetical protein KDK70_09765, partial [Myxococcales bacterium]|nr:hypothetical protein [Myxococcales bacterium]
FRSSARTTEFHTACVQGTPSSYTRVVPKREARPGHDRARADESVLKAITVRDTPLGDLLEEIVLHALM